MARPAKNRRVPLPEGEAERLAALQGCAILDTAPDLRFDRITRIAAATFAAPIAGIAFVDADRLWLKSTLGTAAGERPRDLSLGAHVILADTPTVVADASRDERFRHLPAVTGTPGIRFYAAAPLAVGGQRVGCLFVADSAPRTPPPDQVHVLEDLAALVVDELELGLGQGYAAERAVAAKALADADREAARLRGIVERASQEIYTCDARSLRFLNANQGARENLGYTVDELREMTPLDICPTLTRESVAALLAPLHTGARESVTLECTHRRKDGTSYPASVRIHLHRSGNRDLIFAFVIDRTDFAELTAQMRLAVGAARFHFTNWNLKTGRIERDPGVDRLYGFEDHDPDRGAEAFRARVNPQDLLRNLEAFDAVRRREQPEFDRTFRVLWPNGEQRWLRAVGQLSTLSPDIMVGLQCDVTEATLAAQAQEKSERDLRNLFRDIPDFVSRARPDTTLTFVNDAYARDQQATPAELVGRRFLDLVDAPHGEELRARLARLSPASPMDTNEERRILADGSEQCLLWTNLMIYEDGEPVELICVGRDITAQYAARRTIEAQAQALEQSHDALRISEERFQLAVKGASVGIWDWPIGDGGLQLWSDKLFGLLGLKPGEVEQTMEAFVALVHPDDREPTLEHLRHHLATGDKYECEFRMRHKSGDYRWFLDTGEASRDAEGRPVRMVGTMMDIHDRKVAEAELRRSEERFQLAVQGSSVGVWDWQVAAGGDQFLSDRIFDLIGYAPGEIGSDFDSFFLDRLHPDDLERTQAAIDEHLLHGGTYECEFRLRHKSGEYRWFLDTGKAARDARGNPIRMVGTMMDIHDRKVAEANLKRSEERFRSLYNDTPMMLHSVDSQRRLVAVSDYWLEQMGYAREEVIGRPVLSFMTAASRTEFLRSGASQLDATGQIRDFPHQLERKDGSLMDCLLSAVRTRNEAGEVEQTLAVAIDVTEKRRVEEALARQQRELQLIFDHAPVRIWYKDDQNRILRLNKRAAQAIGMMIASSEGSGLADHDPQAAHRHFSQDMEVIRSGKPMLGVVEQVTTAAGRIEWTRTDRVPYLDPETGRTQMLATATDITEQKTAELELARQKRELQLIFDNVPVKIFYKDDSNRILRVNRRAAESLGLTAEELEGASTDDLFPGQAGKYHAEDLEVIASGQAKLGIIEEYVTPLGRGWVSTDKVPYTDPDTGERNILVTVTDITALKNAQLVMSEQAAALQRSNEELEQFAYVASHDLKAPLRGIDNLASWIEEDLADRMDEESRANMTLLRGRVARLEELLNGLLQYSRIGRSKSDVDTVDLAEAVAEVFDLVRGERRFALRCESLPTLTTGLVPLQLVLRNLISNAIKHHDRTEGTITVSASDLGEHVEISVVDDGPGIDPGFHGRIFGMFQVLRPRDQVEGSGLGLAIIEKQLRTLGCEIRVESDPARGRGTAFRFSWPKCWPYGGATAAAA